MIGIVVGDLHLTEQRGPKRHAVGPRERCGLCRSSTRYHGRKKKYWGHTHEALERHDDFLAALNEWSPQDAAQAEGAVDAAAEWIPSILAHNLGRELQMRCAPRTRGTIPKRPTRWVFDSLGTLRRRLILRVGRLVRPQNRLTLRISGDDSIRDEMQGYLNALNKAA